MTEPEKIRIQYTNIKPDPSRKTVVVDRYYIDKLRKVCEQLEEAPLEVSTHQHHLREVEVFAFACKDIWEIASTLRLILAHTAGDPLPSDIPPGVFV